MRLASLYDCECCTTKKAREEETENERKTLHFSSSFDRKLMKLHHKVAPWFGSILIKLHGDIHLGTLSEEGRERSRCFDIFFLRDCLIFIQRVEEALG